MSSFAAMKDTVAAMSHVELKDDLLRRNLPTDGSKEDMQRRLLGKMEIESNDLLERDLLDSSRVVDNGHGDVYFCSFCTSSHACKHCSTATSWTCFIMPIGGSTAKAVSFDTISQFVPHYFTPEATFLGYVFTTTKATYTIVPNPDGDPQ